MPPNIKKSGSSSSEASAASQGFSVPRKPSEDSATQRGLNITAERELGTIAGVKITGKATVGVDSLIGQQGVTVEVDATNRTVGIGANVGSASGKLGVNIGAKIGYDEKGKLDIKGAEAAVNIGGFGGSASIDDEKGIGGSVSVAGAKVEVTVTPDGKKSLSFCYSIPGGEICSTFEPDPGIKAPVAAPPPIGNNIDDPVIFPIGSQNFCKLVLNSQFWSISTSEFWEYNEHREFERTVIGRAEPFSEQYPSWMVKVDYRYYEKHKISGVIKDFSRQVSTYQEAGRNSSDYYDNGEYVGSTNGVIIQGTESRLYRYLAEKMNSTHPNLWAYAWSHGIAGKLRFTVADGVCYLPNNTSTPPSKLDLPSVKIYLPNYPQTLRPMQCCDKVDEIYKFLGIAKLKKRKFPVSNAFLVPGGTGEDNCIDYYTMFQALFRMLANGLIINPKSKPLGTEWQNTNATAWASSMYEMMAESMSDGNTTQRFEIAAIMQLVQLMSAVAENSRKTEMIIDGLGFEPELVPENLPVCFTIYEAHKGFGKKEPKKINVSTAKTDEQVENILGKMLNPSLIPIVKWQFKPGEISIKEALNG